MTSYEQRARAFKARTVELATGGTGDWDDLVDAAHETGVTDGQAIAIVQVATGELWRKAAAKRAEKEAAQ